MRPTKPSFLFLLILLASILAFAQNTIAQSDPAAVVLLSKSLAVMTGGLPISDVTLQGTAHRIAGSDDETGSAALKALASGDARIDLNLPSGPRSEIRSNSADGPAGAWSGSDGVQHPIALHNLWTDSCWFFPALTFARLSSSPSYSLSYIGQETRGGQTVLHLSAFQVASTGSAKSRSFIQHLSQMDIFLDPASLLPVAISFNVHPDEDAGLDIPVEVRLSDYRLANQAQVPFRIQKYLNNGLVLDLQFQTVALNTGLTASAFSIQ